MHLMLISNSTQYGMSYFEHCAEAFKDLLHGFNTSRILFVPYALKDVDGYTKDVRESLKKYDVQVDSVHEAANAKDAINKARAIFVGGGNTFQLLKGLYDNDLIEPIRKRILEDGIPYVGSSAGTNVATINICTTNDMPIVQPPSFKALGLVPFNINPHYVQPDPNSEHKGETRDERILQYLENPETPPVVGLREGSWLSVDGDKITLSGLTPARIFQHASDAKDYEVGSDLSFLLNKKQ